MDPIIDSDWLGCKNEPPDEAPNVGNFPRSWQWREMGINPGGTLPNKTVMQNIAEDVLVQKQLKIKVLCLSCFVAVQFEMNVPNTKTSISKSRNDSSNRHDPATLQCDTDNG